MTVTNKATATITAKLDVIHRRTDEFGTTFDKIAPESITSLSDGSGSNQIDTVFRKSLVLIGNVVTLVDANTFADAFGNADTFQNVKAIWVENKSTTAGEFVKVGYLNDPVLPDTAWKTPFNSVANSGIILGPGGVFLLSNPIDGWAWASTDQGFYLHTTFPGITVDVVLLGVKA